MTPFLATRHLITSLAGACAAIHALSGQGVSKNAAKGKPSFHASLRDAPQDEVGA